MDAAAAQYIQVKATLDTSNTSLTPNLASISLSYSPSTGSGGTEAGGTSSSNTKPTLVGNELELGTTGTRIKMDGVAVWGIQDNITSNQNTGTNEYNDRQAVVDTIKAWGGNEIRLRVLACDYNASKYMSQAQEIQEIENWQSTAQAAGLYVGVTWWDPSDCGAYNESGANWANDYAEAFPMMSAVVKALGPTNPWVFYEPFNEPNNISDGSWLTAMEATDKLFRSDGYGGILLMDTNDYSHEYNATLMGQLQSNDATQSGMNGKPQVVFAKHDYANEFSGNTTSAGSPYYCFDSSDWPTNNFGTNTWSFTQFPVWETEFGNYNGGYTSSCWSEGAASWMAAQVNNGTLVGASAFVWNWVDANTITNDGTSATSPWGGYVENNFLKSVTH
jgi:hypothetical protein